MEIKNKIIEKAVEVLHSSFKNIDFTVTSEFARAETLGIELLNNPQGVIIEFLNTKVFLDIEEAADMLTPYGKLVAEEFVYEIIKFSLKKQNSDIKKQFKSIESRIKKRRH